MELQKKENLCRKSAVKSAETFNDMKHIKVSLREKPIKEGVKKSLYLDFYPPLINPQTGKQSRREFLGIHVWANPRTKEQRAENKEKMDEANRIRSRREVEANEGKADFLTKRADPDFLEFFVSEIRKRRNKGSRASYDIVLGHLMKYCNIKGDEHLPVSRISRGFCERFRDYLATLETSNGKQLSANTAHDYFVKFRTIVHAAYKGELIERDFASMVDNVKQIPAEREFLTREEVQRLIGTPCVDPLLKRAALFSIYTGLRISDIRKLAWGDVRQDGGEYYLQYRQQKTSKAEILPVSPEAVPLLGERAADEARPFDGLKTTLKPYIDSWMLAAGITKRVTFHCFRHTYATLQISAGTGIYTVSKMLGHSRVETTQIYAKMVDEQRKKAANAISFDLSDLK